MGRDYAAVRFFKICAQPPSVQVILEYFSWSLGEGSFTQGDSDSPEAEDIGAQFGLSSAIVFQWRTGRYSLPSQNLYRFSLYEYPWIYRGCW